MTKQLTLTVGNTVIALKHIESIHVLRENTDKCVDVLKGDIVFGVITVSGKYYDISVIEQISRYKHHGLSDNVKTAQEEIYHRWLKLLLE